MPEIGENGLRIRFRAVGVSFAMGLVTQGKYQRKPPLPFVPGTEVAGIIAQTGSQAMRFKASGGDSRPGARIPQR